MSEASRLRAYRACVNLSVCANGHQILIDDTDSRWADWISAGFLKAVSPPVDYEPPAVPYTRATMAVSEGFELLPPIRDYPEDAEPIPVELAGVDE